MKIAFDLHGTIDSNVELFNTYIQEIMLNNDEIYILSSFSEYEIKDVLLKLNINYFKKFNIISMVDYLKNHTKAINYWFINDINNSKKIFFDDCVWWPLKSFLCDLLNIDVLIDNNIENQKYFGKMHKTNFILFNKSFKLSDLRENVKKL